MSPRHFSREYQQHPDSYLRQQEDIHRVIVSTPAAIVRAATAPARAVSNIINGHKNGSQNYNK